MKFFTDIIKIASIPLHHQIFEVQNQNGYWTTNQLGYKMFIASKTGKIWLPIKLRGKFPDQVLPSEFDALTPEENGSEDYQKWLEDLNNKKSLNNIHDGYNFTDTGKKYIERLKKIFLKHKLDQQGIDMQSFDKMLSTNDLEKIRQIAKSLGKKYRVVSEKMKSEKNPDIERMDKDFNHNWSKLMPLFNYDPNQYNPKIETPEEIHQKKIEADFSSFLSKVKPILDIQMNDVDNILTVLAKAIKDNKIETAKKSWTLLSNILISNIKNHYYHSVGKVSSYIVELPEYKKMHEDLLHDA